MIERLRHLLARFRGEPEETPIMKRYRETMELYELGVALYRQRMRRENPEATEEEVDAMVRAWLREPPPTQFLHRPPRKDDDDTR